MAHPSNHDRCDVAIVGAGLAGGLLALALRAKHPELDVRLIDAGERVGGNHLWSFFGSDVAEADRWLVGVRADLLRGQWTPPERAAVTLGDYLADWQRQRAAQLRPRTRDLYARLSARWLAQPVGTGRHAVHLAPLPLTAISAPLVREWFAQVSTTAHERAAARLLGGSGASRRPGDPARAWARTVGLEVAKGQMCNQGGWEQSHRRRNGWPDASTG